MKTLIATIGLLLWTGLTVNAVDPTPPSLEKTPLPAGPLVNKMPAYAMWRILFTYSTDKPPAKPGSAEASAPPERFSPDATLPPRAVVVTRTRPFYHVVMLDTAGRTSELWFDGGSTYIATPGHPTPSLPMRGKGDTLEIPSYLNYGNADFPDIDWVSEKTYLGTLVASSTTSYWVFRQGANGPTVWIDTDSRLPARWQNGGETRKFEFLTAPTEKLALPPAVLEASKVVRRIDEITSHRAPRGS